MHHVSGIWGYICIVETDVCCTLDIPILAEADRELFAVSVCTVDGQEYSFGDTDALFSFQSCVKPLLYALALEENGSKKVHQHVGHEASGLAFNEVSLNRDNLPHNPMVRQLLPHSID